MRTLLLRDVNAGRNCNFTFTDVSKEHITLIRVGGSYKNDQLVKGNMLKHRYTACHPSMPQLSISILWKFQIICDIYTQVIFKISSCGGLRRLLVSTTNDV